MDDVIAKARRALAWGVGMTSRRNKVLPAENPLAPIPARVGRALSLAQHALKHAKRGFVARVVSALKAAMFSPYTLSILDAAHSVFGHSYTVLPVTTTFNVDVGDITLWRDIASFHSGKVLINGVEMAKLECLGAPGSRFLPWVITDAGAEPYGTALGNASTKRVFAVGTDTVQSWFLEDVLGSMVPVVRTLNGASYRPSKALQCGPQLDVGNSMARLSQLVFTGTSWDAYSSGWAMTTAQIVMLLTPPYLQKTDGVVTVDQPTANPQVGINVESTSSSSATLPEVEALLVGVGELGASDFGNLSYDNYQVVIFPWRELYKTSINGDLNTNITTSPWVDSFSTTTNINDLTASIAASNSVMSRNNSESYSFPVQNKTIFGSIPGGMVLTDNGNINTSTGVVTWVSSGDLVPRGGGVGGGYGIWHHNAASVPGTAAYTTKDQTGAFSISIPGSVLAKIDFSRSKESGDRVIPAAINGRFSPFLSNPYGWLNASSGIGVGSQLKTRIYTLSPEAVVGLRQGPITARAAGHVGGKYYDTLADDDIVQLYSSTIGSRPTKDDQSLSWQSKDFILFDSANSVYISVDGSFTGSQHYGSSGIGNLSVSLRITTPAGMTSKILYEKTITYADLLPEVMAEPGVIYVPSPQQRVIFAPLHREQGTFKGAAYTTIGESADGAVLAYLFNFALKLENYTAIGTDNFDSPLVHFVPCNLIEMLYAFVYSSKFGVDLVERYPVDRPVDFSAIQSGLFGVQFPIHYRDGVDVDWLDMLGGSYVDPTTTEIYRL